MFQSHEIHKDFKIYEGGWHHLNQSQYFSEILFCSDKSPFTEHKGRIFRMGHHSNKEDGTLPIIPLFAIEILRKSHKMYCDMESLYFLVAPSHEWSDLSGHHGVRVHVCMCV